MEVNSISKGYREYNEDMVIVIKDHLFVVVDAATALCPPHHLPTDGVYLNNKLKEEILSLYNNKKLKPSNFEKEMNRVSKRLYKDFIKGHKDIKERYQFPCAAMAFCFIDVCDVHIFTIGDCVAFIRQKDGRCKYISDKTIPLMDKKAVDYYQSIDIYEFEEMYEVLRKNRDLLNKNGKRAMFSLYPKPNLKFKHQVFDIRELSEVYLCSDGYYDAFEDLKFFKSRRALFNIKNDLQDVYHMILSESQKEDTLKRYPRLKRIDDISAVRVTF